MACVFPTGGSTDRLDPHLPGAPGYAARRRSRGDLLEGALGQYLHHGRFLQLHFDAIGDLHVDVAVAHARDLAEDTASRDDFIAGCSDRSKFVLFYVEGFSMELLARIRQYVLDRGFREVMITHTGSVIACHGGPGALCLAAY